MRGVKFFQSASKEQNFLSRRVKQIFNNQQTIYEKETENKSYRFYALKAQINPHFPYNTLDCHMLLQPLAENSVKRNSLFVKKLIIYIKVYVHGEPSSGHIGIHNINTRIKLMYGIQLVGRKNRYIKISVKIPIDNIIGNSADSEGNMNEFV